MSKIDLKKLEQMCINIMQEIIEGCEESNAEFSTNAVFNFNPADVEKGIPENFAIKWINPVNRKKYYVTVVITAMKD